jgi:hypothetical protein
LWWHATPGNNWDIVGGLNVPTVQIATLVCPTDPVGKATPGRGTANGGPWGRLSYVGNIGDISVLPDGGRNSSDGARGAHFRGTIGAGYTPIGFNAVSDGLSNTLLFSEAVIGTLGSTLVKGGIAVGAEVGIWGQPINCLNRRGANGQLTGEVKQAGDGDNRGEDTMPGRAWMSGVFFTGYFHAILPPNSPSCTQGQEGYWGNNMAASSFHTGGVNVGMSDGAVRFVSETIDCGRIDQSSCDFRGDWSNSPYSGRSPYGVWGSVGSRRGGESATLP